MCSGITEPTLSRNMTKTKINSTKNINSRSKLTKPDMHI